MQGKKLYVGNLSYSVTEEQLRELFGAHGTVTEVILIKDRETGRAKGFGFVEFSSSDEAQKAMDALNGSEHEGRNLKVNEALQKPQNRDNNRGRY